MTDKYADRNRRIAETYVKGKISLVAVGKMFGIGPERVRQIVARSERAKRIDGIRLKQRSALVELLKSHFQI